MGVEIDIDSLQDFRTALATRLSQAQTILTAVTNHIDGSQPPVGTFADAGIYSGDTQTKNTAYLDRVTKLRDSLNVAIQGTDQIINNYRTVEDLNHANADYVAQRLDGINNTLNPQGQNPNGAV